jgi:hypothetical protein
MRRCTLRPFEAEEHSHIFFSLANLLESPIGPDLWDWLSSREREHRYLPTLGREIEKQALLPCRQDDLSARTQPLESSSMFRIRSEVQDFDFPDMTDYDPDAPENRGIVEEEIPGSETE